MWWQRVVRRAAAFGDAPAVSDERRSLGYAELRDRVLRLAGGLRRQGVGPGDRVALLARNSVETIEALIALSLAGAVTVPLNHRLTATELNALVAALEVVVIEVGGEDWEAMARGRPIDPVERLPAAPELGLLTSGTTSRPRCALLDARAVQAAALSWLATVRPSPNEVYFSCTPLFHSTLMIAIAYLGIGAHLVVTRDFTPQRSLETIERLRVTQMYMVPSMLALTLRARGLAARDHWSLREIFHGGAAMDPRLAAAAGEAFGAELRDCYGQAQAGGPIAVSGVPLLGMEVRIGGGAGGIGEVHVRGDALMSGYLAEPEASAEVLEDGWLRTGDLGRVDERGELRLVGRSSDTIIRGGQNVYPAEIEEALLGLDGVEDAAVVGLADEVWGEVPVAAVVARAKVPLGEADLAAHCRRRLAPYKRPVAFELRRELPRNAAGKVLRSRLREAFEWSREGRGGA